SPALYRAYKEGGERVLQKLVRLQAKMRVDQVDGRTVRAFIDEHGLDELAALVQTVIPPSSAVMGLGGTRILQGFVDAGDRRGAIPAALRGRDFGGGEADRSRNVGWHLGEGMEADADGGIRHILAALSASDLAASDREQDQQHFRTALRAYLQGERSDQ